MNFSRKKLDARLAHIDEQIKNYLADIEVSDQKADEPQAIDALSKLLERKELYEAYKEQLDQTNTNELSAVDPDARLMGNNRGGVDMAYNVQSAVDGKHDIIVEYDVSMNPSDQHQLSSMVKKVTRKLRLKKFTVLTDKGYYNGADLLKLKRLKVKAVVSKQKPSDSKDLPAEFRSGNFMYDEKNDAYICPKGQELRPHSKKDAKRRNYFNKSACAVCTHANECVAGNSKYRTVTRSQYAKIYEETDRRFAENSELYKRRQQIVEHPFGTVKHTMHGGQFLLRTRRKVCGEVALLFLGYNLKRALNVLGFDGLMARLNSLLQRFLRPTGIIRINFVVFLHFPESLAAVLKQSDGFVTFVKSNAISLLTRCIKSDCGRVSPAPKNRRRKNSSCRPRYFSCLLQNVLYRQYNTLRRNGALPRRISFPFTACFFFNDKRKNQKPAAG